MAPRAFVRAAVRQAFCCSENENAACSTRITYPLLHGSIYTTMSHYRIHTHTYIHTYAWYIHIYVYKCVHEHTHSVAGNINSTVAERAMLSERRGCVEKSLRVWHNGVINHFAARESPSRLVFPIQLGTALPKRPIYRIQSYPPASSYYRVSINSALPRDFRDSSSDGECVKRIEFTYL